MNTFYINKSTKIDSDSDSSSDYDPLKNEFDDMSTIEMQRFMQKIFPSKSGKERLKQLEKIDNKMGIVIAKVGEKKREEIKKMAKEKGIKVLNRYGKKILEKNLSKKIKKIWYFLRIKKINYTLI